MSQTAFNALIDGYGYGANPAPPDPTQGQTNSPAFAPHAGAIQGTPPLFGPHNTPLHVGLLGVAALLIVIGLRLAGFRFSVAGNLGRG
jgi:hypothetical protein